jgi:hypothetical protein
VGGGGGRGESGCGARTEEPKTGLLLWQSPLLKDREVQVPLSQFGLAQKDVTPPVLSALHVVR